MSATGPSSVLHYVGYDVDRGGILAVIRALAGEGVFPCVLGVNPAFAPRPGNALETLRLSAVAGEEIGVGAAWRARRVAREVRAWLRADERRVFHGHSRAGLLVALWLHAWGERRVVATVHCYGRRRWFYRWAAARLRERLFWLSPEMKRYYRLPDDSVSADRWAGCLPGCVPASAPLARREARRATIRLAGVGTIVRWKRWHLVVEAMASLPAGQREKFSFRHIGGVDGSADARAYADELRRRTTACGLDAAIAWEGEQPAAGALLAESDYLVVASQGEPLSIAMLEALFAGVPVLAAASGGAPDVIAPPVNGRLFQGDGVEGLARVLGELAADDCGAAVRIDRAGLERFTAARSAAEHAAIYRSLLTP